MKLDENCDQCGARLRVSRWQLARHFAKFPVYLGLGWMGAMTFTRGPVLKLKCQRCGHTQSLTPP